MWMLTLDLEPHEQWLKLLKLRHQPKHRLRSNQAQILNEDRMHLEEVLREYGRRQGLGKLELDDEGICRLMINKTSTISFEESFTLAGFFMYAAVGVLTLEQEKETALMALSANLFGRETGRSYLGYDANTRALVLFEFVSSEGLTYARFQTYFEEFIHYMLYWISKFEEVQTQTTGVPSFKKGMHHGEEDKNIFFA